MTPILINTMLRIDLIFFSFCLRFYYWRVTTPTRSAAARMTPSTMHASPTAPAPQPERRPAPDMYFRTSARIISCIAATSSPLNGYCCGGAAGCVGGESGDGGDGDREGESAWKWLRALSWRNPEEAWRSCCPGSESERDSEVSGSSSRGGGGGGGRARTSAAAANPPARGTGRNTCAPPPTEPWLSSLRSDPVGLPGPGLTRLHGRSTASPSPPDSAALAVESFRLSDEFQWFFTALSVRPGRSRAMAAHRLPSRAWARRIVASSSGVNGRRSTCGDSWLHHRSRHDLPDRPGMPRPIAVQFRAPWRSTSRRSASSSSGLQGPFILSHSASPPIADYCSAPI
ncbi:hypothetical protein QOZ80_2BG0157670 [Eleusine coracana subsp. coracana]|nr:hypothetical protein QOZ80_2BG0157670 [Eleusine coracana subsp. coracana]